MNPDIPSTPQPQIPPSQPNIPPPPPMPPPVSTPNEQITQIENPPVIPPPSDVPLHKKTSKKLITIVLAGVAIFIALYAGAYLFMNDRLNSLFGAKPTPTLAPQPTKPVNPMANWQTYTNNDLGFSVKFPGDWKVTDESTSSDSPKQIRFTPENASIPSGLGTRPYGYEFIIAVDKENSQTPEQFWEVKVETGMRTPTTESITVDNTLGILTSNNALDAHDTTIYVSKNNALYTIQENYYVSDGDQAKKQFPQAEKEFEQILSTFTFLNEQTVCANEERICPDGKTSVGRTGPNCEFAACP